MGVNFTQHCILGLQVEADDILVVTQPAKYEEHPRYNTVNGKVTHMQKVLVQDEQAYYKFLGCQNESLWELGEDIAEKYGLDFTCDEETLSIGISIGENQDCGRVDLIEGSEPIEYLHDVAIEVAGKFGCSPDKIALHFVTNVG